MFRSNACPILVYRLSLEPPAANAATKGYGFFVQGLREAPVYSNEVPMGRPSGLEEFKLQRKKCLLIDGL